ncbi:MarR family transcriptional regulator [Massilia pinisoli]|uniref:MarR family transcriptional regulator n=1 Tax=Massilia pinisoli TaxID=1772194 RepID=A0ABT1ZP80_9BURK|nr:MarR family transcriptional regulator [Massilia pinisoli]MCS0581717.1 MarR family transcriptional regulator [Massilia pinisoli]
MNNADDPDDRFLHALQGAARAWRFALERHLKAHGLTTAAWNALAAVADSTEPPSQRELARRLGVDGATLVTTIDRLAAGDLVRRDAAPGDRRVKRIGLTPAGASVAAQVRADAAALRARTVARLDADATAAAAGLLDDLQRLLEGA